MYNSKSNLNPIQKLDYIMSNNSTSLILKRTKVDEIQIFEDRGFDYYSLGYLVAKWGEIFYVYPNESELFRKHNGLGALTELLDNECFQFERMIFKYLGKGYITTRSKFLSHGIEEQFDFGKKTFLPLQYFSVQNPEQPTLNF